MTKKKKPTEKKPEQKPEPEIVPLKPEQEDRLGAAHEAIGAAVDMLLEEAAKSGKLPNEEFANAKMFAETAEMWMARGFEALGYDPVDEDEEEEEESDEDEEPDES